MSGESKPPAGQDDETLIREATNKRAVSAQDAYKIHVDSAHRYDYFITGAAGVALGFALKEFAPATGPTAAFLLPIAWILLLVSLGAGITHLEIQRGFFKIAADAHDPALYSTSLAKLNRAIGLMNFWGTARNVGLLGGVCVLVLWRALNL